MNTKEYNIIRNQLNDYILFNTQEPQFDKNEFIRLNPNSYNTYYLLGRYYLKQSKHKDAKNLFTIALTKNLPSQSLKNEIKNYLAEIK